MKKIFKYSAIALLGMSICSCDAIFDNLEGDLSKMTEADLTSSSAGIERLLSYAYQQLPIDAFGTSDKNTIYATDTHGASISMPTSGSISYSALRSVNKLFPLLESALAAKTLDQAQYDVLVGEATFIRAYLYFNAVKALGGVPIITEPLDDKLKGEDFSELFIPRETEKGTWDFVIKQLDEAAKLLPEKNAYGQFRANKYAAIALKSRVALYAASLSKYWDKAPFASTYQSVASKKTYMEASYANAYYQIASDAAAEIINSGVYKLYGGATADKETAAKNLFGLFTSLHEEEFIFGKSSATGASGATNGWDYNNSPNQGHVRTVGWQWARYSITSQMVDEFDNYAADGSRLPGKVATRVDGNEDYAISQISQKTSTFDPSVNYIKYDKPQDAFKNKDARFEAWVLYPGQQFRGMTLVMQGGIVENGKANFYNPNYSAKGKDGKTYWCLGAEFASEYSAFNALTDENAGNWFSTGFGIKKFLLEAAAEYSTNPWYDLRYAEILLNYAEAYAEAGVGDAALAKKCLNDIRHRAAFTDDIEPTIENVMHERLVELAFEGDYPRTLHRRREAVLANPAVHTGAIVPAIDLRESTPKYIMIRANQWHDDVDTHPGAWNINPMGYYSGISNYQKNDFEPNPSQDTGK